MTPREQEALAIVKKKKIKSSAKLGKEMDITRQRADILLKSLQDQGMVKYFPAQWKIVE